jgi:hypothetical protein
MPNGRLLHIERKRYLGKAPWLQDAIRIFFVPGIFGATLLVGPSTPLLIFGGLWSFIPALIAMTCLAALIQKNLLNWMRHSTGGLDSCYVVGMDCSTREFQTIAREFSDFPPFEGTVH